jgi:hypothetical protein
MLGISSAVGMVDPDASMSVENLIKQAVLWRCALLTKGRFQNLLTSVLTESVEKVRHRVNRLVCRGDLHHSRRRRRESNPRPVWSHP